MADILFPSKDPVPSTGVMGPNLPAASLDLAAAEIAARTGSTQVLDQILSQPDEHRPDRHYTDHWGINE